MELDRAEKEILEVLQIHGRIANVDLAEKVGLSDSPCYHLYFIREG
jgi:Lrp/AsnC family leucine-responsive transcriptional regulator